MAAMESQGIAASAAMVDDAMQGLDVTNPINGQPVPDGLLVPAMQPQHAEPTMQDLWDTSGRVTSFKDLFPWMQGLELRLS